MRHKHAQWWFRCKSFSTAVSDRVENTLWATCRVMPGKFSVACVQIAEERQQCPRSWRGFEARSFCRHFTHGNGPAVVMVLTEVTWFTSFVCMSDAATGRQSSKMWLKSQGSLLLPNSYTNQQVKRPHWFDVNLKMPLIWQKSVDPTHLTEVSRPHWFDRSQ